MDPIKLMRKAVEASEKAYAPYSNYWVGAAIQSKCGTIFTGCNIENAAYGSTMCAERSAVFSAVSAGQRKFDALVIVASGPDYPYPCGACRQVLAEFCRPDLPIYVALTGDLEHFDTTTLGELLPHAFNLGQAHA